MCFWWNYVYDMYIFVMGDSRDGGGSMSCFSAEMVGFKISVISLKCIYLNMGMKCSVNNSSTPTSAPLSPTATYGTCQKQLPPYIQTERRYALRPSNQLRQRPSIHPKHWMWLSAADLGAPHIDVKWETLRNHFQRRSLYVHYLCLIRLFCWSNSTLDVSLSD